MEPLEQQTRDSDTIFTAISTGDFDSFKMAERAVVMFDFQGGHKPCLEAA